jgi:hypothetical protein
MLQSNDTENPYLLQHLIIHGVLAVAFLAAGWLFPAQYRTLHTDALAQASVEEGQTLEEFRDSLGETNQLGAGQLLDLAAQQLGPSTNTLKTLPTTPALDPFFSPSHRRTVKARLGSETKRVNQLLALENQAADYAASIILAAQLEANGQFHQDLNQQLHSLGLDANTDELREAMHALSLLASRLTEPQLGLLMRHTESTLTLMRLAKIAKLQTLVSPFDTFNEVDENGKSDDVVTSDELIDTPFRHLFGHPVKHNAQGQPIQWDADKNGKLTREEWTALPFIPLQLTEFPAVYAASVWSEQPEEVTRYLMTHGQPGTRWLQNAMRQGRGSMKMVLDRQLPVSDRAGLGLDSAAAFSLRHPGWALFVKFLLLGLGCIILMRAWNSFFTVSATGANAVRDFILRRRAMACALFLSLVALGEPIFLQPAQSSEYTVSINLPVLSEDENQTSNPENNIAMLANSNIVLNSILFLAFAAIQLFVYLTCKSKVDEIRQGEGDPLLKLRLLENEDNLFDMGLYIGIAGTALTLAIKMLAPQFGISLSVAYASNIFGILCVALVKIHHVRGTRQQLIMDAETTTGAQTH